MVELRWYVPGTSYAPDLQVRRSEAEPWSSVQVVRAEDEIVSAMHGTDSEKMDRVTALIMRNQPPKGIRWTSCASTILNES